MSVLHNFVVICRMIKIEHSIFALPFAWTGAFLAKGGWPGAESLLPLTVAMVGIRSFAMAFNRAADLRYDRLNPRTVDRPLVTGEITLVQTWCFCGIMAALFVFSCAAMNPLCLALSPLALAGAVLYSYAKRCTWLCHFVLGAVIALSPIGGWLSVSPTYALLPFLLAFAVLFWIAGFDILYACQDRIFDAEIGLHSLPVRFGLEGAMIVSAFCHVNTVLFLCLAGMAGALAWGWYLTLAVSAGILWWEHRLVSASKLEKIRLAFALNGPVSLLLLAGALLGILA